MIRLNLAALEPGMILARSVSTPQDVLLVAEGAELTEKNIRILKSWGVAEAWVEGDGPAAGSGRSRGAAGDHQAAIEQDLRAKFADVLDDPVMQAVMRAAAKHLEARRLKNSANK